MQVLIMNSSLGASRLLQFSRLQLGLVVAGVLLILVMLSGTVYHVIFLKAAREGWPVVSQLVQLIGRDEVAQRDRYLRENLDAMARRLGEMQARMVQLEAMSERVSGLAGIKSQELQQMLKASPAGGGKGGPFVPALPGTASPSLEALDGMLAELGAQAEQRIDLFTLVESRLFEKRLAALMVPNSRPVDGPVGSGFGFRADPFSGRAALHTGLDFPADVGTPVHAAAGGVVLQAEFHPQYGHMIELDHGRGLVTRYAHASKVLVKVGDLIKRGQLIAQVGSSGRSTGSHLHFEVLVEGVPQDPARFLSPTSAAPVSTASTETGRR
jgi:murein DD-endopeptidase MepM/ murein hydrolase activator NlpD